MNLNSEISELIRNHGYKVSVLHNKLVPDFKEKVFIDSNITSREYENNFSSKLDVKIEFSNGLELYESFGDLGENLNDAIQNNLENFSRNSFHVILNALNDSEDEQITYEEWKINNQNWDVWIGNMGIKQGFEGELNIPENLFIEIEKAIVQKDFNNNFHWVRFFFSQYDNKTAAIEFLVDNEMDTENMNKLSQLDWEKMEDFYSIRNFIMLKKKATYNIS